MERARLVGKQASVEEIRPGERDLLRRLREYPELTAKIETLLAIIENAGGDVEKVAEAERRIIEGARWETRRCTVGRTVSRRKRKRHMMPSRG